MTNPPAQPPEHGDREMPPGCCQRFAPLCRRYGSGSRGGERPCPHRACYLVGRPQQRGRRSGSYNGDEKRSVQVEIQGVVRVPVTTGKSETSVGWEGDPLGAQGDGEQGGAQGLCGGLCGARGGGRGGLCGGTGCSSPAPLSVVLPTHPRWPCFCLEGTSV